MKNKKICLIITPSVFLLDERVFPFLGPLKVAACYEKAGYKVDVLDFSGVENYLDVLNDYMILNEKDLYFIGVTGTTPQAPACYRIGKFLKENFDVKKVIGGPHVTLSHTAYKRELKNGILDGRAKKAVETLESVFDVLICGDGEFSLEPILNTENGILDFDDRMSPYFLTDKTFSESPYPARHLISLKDYNYKIENEKATHLLLQLGCVMRCNFCSGRYSPSLRVMRNRTVESAIGEIDFLFKNYGYLAYNFFDDELNISKNFLQLMNAISDYQDEQGVSFNLRGFTKAELVNEEQIVAMKRAGFKWLLTGFESGNEKILKNIRKNATKDDNTRCVELAKKHGLKTKALMSCGHSGENYETIEDTKKWLIDMEVEEFDMTVISPFCGSPYYDDAIKKEEGLYIFTDPKSGDKLYQKEIDYSKESHYYKGIPGNYVSYVWTDYLKSEELVKLRDLVEKEVREKLNIPYNSSGVTKKYDFEHSMGQGNIPDWILRSTKEIEQKEEKEKLKLKVI